MRHFLTYRTQVRNRVRYLEDRTPFQPYLPPKGPERVFAVVEGLTEKQFKLLHATLTTSLEESHAVLSWWNEDELRERDEPLLLNFRRQWKALCESEESSSERAKPNRDLRFLKLFRDTLTEVLKYDAPKDLTTRASSPFLNEMTAKLKSGKFSLLDLERDRNRAPDGWPVPPSRQLEPHEIEGSALFWLNGWGVRLRNRQENPRRGSTGDARNFRPDSHASKALDFLEVKYPGAIHQIHKFLDSADSRFAEFLANPNDKTRYALAQAEGELTRRVTSAVNVIIEYEKQAYSQRAITAAKMNCVDDPKADRNLETETKSPSTKAGKRKKPLTLEEANAIAIKLFKKDKLFVLRSQRDWAKAIGIANERVPTLPLYKASQPQRNEHRPKTARRPRNVSPNTQSASWLDNLSGKGEKDVMTELIKQEEIRKLEAEQAAEIREDEQKGKLTKKYPKVDS